MNLGLPEGAAMDSWAPSDRSRGAIKHCWETVDEELQTVERWQDGREDDAVVVFIALRNVRDNLMVILNKFRTGDRSKIDPERFMEFSANLKELTKTLEEGPPDHALEPGLMTAIRSLQSPYGGGDSIHSVAPGGVKKRLEQLPHEQFAHFFTYVAQATLAEADADAKIAHLTSALAPLRENRPRRARSRQFHVRKKNPVHDYVDRWLDRLQGLEFAAPDGITPFVGTNLPRAEGLLGRLEFGAGIEHRVRNAKVDGLLPFFEALVSDPSRLAGRTTDVLSGSAWDSAAVAEPVVELQFALLHLAHNATLAFSQAMTRSLPPIYDWDALVVDLVPGQIESHLKGLADVCRILESPEVDNRHQPLLGAKGMLRRFRGMEELAREGLSSGSLQLAGAELEWITDVLWHALTFRSPTYPLGDELALQVSLVLDSLGTRPPPFPRRRLDPASSVMRNEYSQLAVTISNCLERGLSDPDRPPSLLLESIVAAVRSDYILWKGQRTRPFPIVVSSSFDLELERAFSRTSEGSIAYHVALPVLVTERLQDRHERTTEKVSLRWLVGAFASQSTGERVSDLRRPLQGWRWADEGEAKFDGPLVLKMTGSPLHILDEQTLPGAAGKEGTLIRGGELDINHAVAFGEFDVMQYLTLDSYTFDARRWAGIDPGQGLPTWLVEELVKSDRLWLLIGQQLDDWNARMQVFVNVTRVAALRQDHLYAVAVSWEEHRKGLLEALGVQLLTDRDDVLAHSLFDYASRGTT